MAKEIELKLALPEDWQRSLLRLPLLKEAAEKHSGHLTNIYYDTPDLALRRLGIALRLRRQRGVWLQTVKCAGQSAGGLTTRPEWETPYQGQFDFSAVDDAAVRAQLERPKLRSRLAPVFETSFLRTAWRFDGLLLVLDRGWIASAGRREAISELELEATDDGSVGNIYALAERLAERVPLAPALLSKAERGYRLFQARPSTPTKAAPLPPAIAMLEPLAAFRAIAFACLEHLQLNRDGAVASQDPEYIHQMRVATRRLRACVRLFAPLLPPSFTEALLPPLRSLMSLLGQVRDLDVLLEEIVAPVTTALATEPRLAALAGVITDRRYHARANATRLLESPKYGQMTLRIAALLHGLDQDDNGAPTTTLETFALDRLRRLRNKVRRLAGAAKLDDPVSIHAVRIGVKRLRYALEFFTPLAHGKARRRLAERLAEVQTTLGQLNDLASAGRLLMDCAGEDLRLREAVTLIAGWHGPRHAALLDKLPPLLDDLTRLPRLR